MNYPQIIKCPDCGCMFKLNQKPSKTFCCPRCQHKAPFDEVLRLNDSAATQLESTPSNSNNCVSASTTVSEATKVVNFGEKTKLVPGLQQPKFQTATFIIIFKGIRIGSVTLPQSGSFNLGRRSKDSQAQIKIAPDMTMSRVHAAMRAIRANDGQIMYQITTIKPENPVYVNGTMVMKGKVHTLKSGDMIQLGETVMTFKLD